MNNQQLIHKLIDIIKYKETFQNNTSSLLPQDMYILERIYMHGKINQKTISSKYHIPPSTLTGIVDRLESKDLIQRVRVQKNRKIVLLSITEQGKEIVEQHINEDEVFTENLFNTLPIHKRTLLKQLMVELVEKIDMDALFNTKELDK
ncbi:MarR family winged helix-turn-helix transcriptional regulator [Alkaliphilus peptidifermentans]|uniref:DNA-binding transcriptional regulator, MarR family n=1 Tax=Alkaliphilus peptidifermentans DSM 18978 TaxID=1120976 RepID=A0A1G5J3Z2_9FIRM|nr:MarR family transcriptional regulator [Alkaliphilus peptidifermentans]SCY83002.1 DNA-binding transcriptional regulator, MarR family [Alkaliphilus peptidifermentans DSM 18978]